MNEEALQGIANDIQQCLNTGALDQAEAKARAVLASGTGPLNIWHMLADAVRKQGRIEEAKVLQEMMLEHLPQNVALRFELAETLLLLGEFDRGWREYRFRYSLPHTTNLERKVQTPRWDGAPIAGKTLLIHDEQGFGDTLQFIRMMPWVKKRSQANIVLQISPELASFGRRIPGADKIIIRGELPGPFDLHCEMMSLPMAMKLQMSDLPGEIPYFRPDRARLEIWRKKLASIRGPKIALVWAGRPTHLNDANRSMDLAQLAPLAAENKDITFLSVQKGPKSDEANTPPENMKIVNLSDDIQDFEDTAAILSLADLLISVDSSPVHLAGALGRPVWTMLPFVPDWRWLMNRSDTPWYPDMRLFRQNQIGNWGDVVSEMAKAIPAFLKSRA
ncbi:glycosyltransferase family 9 protein [Thalassospira alkalitolerans]|uniref:glycosyltransferase family 9 protein n=1 Tax=Thalassospira alkalitolerans TaxID=1293890 RepID=UPI0030EF2554|tara:strand:+ start:36169 stop:37338 length:1170 start_codon:yes stop_codon:yes gene_type:complete